MRPTIRALDVSGKDPDTIQTNLTAAVGTAIRQAIALGRHGILVTQHAYNDFSVTLHPDVPYGQTREERRFDKAPGEATQPETDPTGKADPPLGSQRDSPGC